MIENLIKQIVTSFDGLYYIDVEDSGEGSLYGVGVGFLDTMTYDKTDYENWEDMLDSIDIITPNFQIYCSYDRSGYDYWTNRMEESNYTYIRIWVSDDFSDEDFKSLYNEVEKIYERFDYFNAYRK